MVISKQANEEVNKGRAFSCLGVLMFCLLSFVQYPVCAVVE